MDAILEQAEIPAAVEAVFVLGLPEGLLDSVSDLLGFLVLGALLEFDPSLFIRVLLAGPLPAKGDAHVHSRALDSLEDVGVIIGLVASVDGSGRPKDRSWSNSSRKALLSALFPNKGTILVTMRVLASTDAWVL